MTWRIRMKVLFQVRAGPLHHPPAPSSRGYALDEEGEGSTAGGCCADGGDTRPTIPVAGGAQMITVPRRVFFRRCLVWSNRTVPWPTDFALAAMPRRAVEHSCNQIQTHEFA